MYIVAKSTERRTHTSPNVELDRTISIPLDLDEIAYDGGAVFVVAGFCYVIPEGLHVPGGGGAVFGNLFTLSQVRPATRPHSGL